MNFNSFTFFVFLIPVLAAYYLLPWRFGRYALLLGSYAFYGSAQPWYCILLLISTVVDYLVCLRMAAIEVRSRRRNYLLLSIVVNIGLLATFKYGAFIAENLSFLVPGARSASMPFSNIILPVGISFYTFQTLSYTIDVYRGRLKPCRSFINFALYVSFFPQLVAGPIERADKLIPQLSRKNAWDSNNFMLGLERVLWGLIKKTVFADRLAVFVNEVYAAPSEASSLVLLLAATAFLLQLYLDFSAYCDIALGTARMLGVRLSENFNYPLAARNSSDFWNRWHITLTSWFRDYVFRPLGGTRRSAPVRSMFNTLLVFTLIGLWHGAAWNFVLFGFIAGISLLIYQNMRVYMPRRGRGSLLGKGVPGRYIAVALNLPVIIGIGVFFRSPDLHTAWLVFTGFFQNGLVLPRPYLPYAVLALLLLGVHFSRGWWRKKNGNGKEGATLWTALRMGIYYFILVFAAYEYRETFIYFQF